MRPYLITPEGPVARIGQASPERQQTQMRHSPKASPPCRRGDCQRTAAREKAVRDAMEEKDATILQLREENATLAAQLVAAEAQHGECKAVEAATHAELAALMDAMEGRLEAHTARGVVMCSAYAELEVITTVCEDAHHTVDALYVLHERLQGVMAAELAAFDEVADDLQSSYASCRNDGVAPSSTQTAFTSSLASSEVVLTSVNLAPGDGTVGCGDRPSSPASSLLSCASEEHHGMGCTDGRCDVLAAGSAVSRRQPPGTLRIPSSSSGDPETVSSMPSPAARLWTRPMELQAMLEAWREASLPPCEELSNEPASPRTPRCRYALDRCDKDALRRSGDRGQALLQWTKRLLEKADALAERVAALYDLHYASLHAVVAQPARRAGAAESLVEELHATNRYYARRHAVMSTQLDAALARQQQYKERFMMACERAGTTNPYRLIPKSPRTPTSPLLSQKAPWRPPSAGME